MADTKCFYCNGLIFELKAIDILDSVESHKRHRVIQCANPVCGMPIGLVPARDVSEILEAMSQRDAEFRKQTHDRLKAIEQRLDRLFLGAG